MSLPIHSDGSEALHSSIVTVKRLVEKLDYMTWLVINENANSMDVAKLDVSLAYTLLSMLYSLICIEENAALKQMILSELERIQSRIKKINNIEKGIQAPVRTLAVDTAAATRMIQHEIRGNP